MLRRFLPSVIENSGDAEIVVADNASADNSVEVVKKEFPGVRLIIMDENYGFADGYNRALEQVDSEYSVLLNSDVEVTSGWLEPLERFMDANPSAVACQPKLLDYKRKTHFEYAGASGGFLDRYGYPYCRGRIFDTVEQDSGQYDDITKVIWATGAALFVRTAEYKSAGGLDGRFFAHMEEIDLCWRMNMRGGELYVVPESKVYHVGGATLSKSNPRKTYLNFRNNLIMMVKNYNSKLWPLIILARLIMDGMAGMMYLVQGKPRFVWAIVRAHWAFFGKLSATLNKRKALASQRSNTLPKEIYRGLFYFAKPMKN